MYTALLSISACQFIATTSQCDAKCLNKTMFPIHIYKNIYIIYMDLQSSCFPIKYDVNGWI